MAGLWESITENLGGLGQLGGLIGGGALVNEAYGNLSDLAKTAYNRSQTLADKGLQQTQFKPFTVTTGLGVTQATPEGGYTQTLSPQQQALQQQLFGGAQGFYGQAMQDQAARQQDVYNALRAMQTPEEQRQQLSLEERLYNQGRLGVATSQYGGTPEQFALDKARAEAQNQAALMAMQQAQAEQRQQAELGQIYQQGGYVPYTQMLAGMTPALQGAQLQSGLQQYGAGLYGEALMGGLNAQLASRIQQANMMGQLGSGLLGGVMNQMNAQIANPNVGQSSLGGLLGSVGSAIGGLFSGSGGGGSGSPINTNLINSIFSGGGSNYSTQDIINNPNILWGNSYVPEYNISPIGTYPSGSTGGFNIDSSNWTYGLQG